MENLSDRMTALEHAQRAAEGARRITERRLRAWQAAAALLALPGLLLALPHAGKADNQAGGLPALEKRVAALEVSSASQAAQIAALQTALANEAAARQAADTALQNNLNAEAAARAAGDASLQNQITPLADTLSHFSIQTIDGFYSVVLTAANLHIINGLGATNGNPASPYDVFTGATNGLGNLVIGYNESRAPLFALPDDRSGSHNLVLGQGENYSSFGGLVAGRFDTISGAYASVSGGDFNTASDAHASVSGGANNTASGPAASVSGGQGNTASDVYASVSGGNLNTASGNTASVSGGEGNIASGPAASVSGGEGNIASGDVASVSGGVYITQPNAFGWSAGGNFFPGGGIGVFHSP